jgi:hypothetical protein
MMLCVLLRHSNLVMPATGLYPAGGRRSSLSCRHFVAIPGVDQCTSNSLCCISHLALSLRRMCSPSRWQRNKQQHYNAGSVDMGVLGHCLWLCNPSVKRYLHSIDCG